MPFRVWVQWRHVKMERADSQRNIKPIRLLRHLNWIFIKFSPMVWRLVTYFGMTRKPFRFRDIFLNTSMYAKTALFKKLSNWNVRKYLQINSKTSRRTIVTRQMLFFAVVRCLTSSRTGGTGSNKIAFGIRGMCGILLFQADCVMVTL